MDAADALQPTWMSRLVEVLQPVSVRADRLSTIPILAGLERPILELAAGLVSETLVERGTRLTVQGASSTRLWLILEGQALISADARPVRVTAHGDVLGLSSLLLGTLSPETALALTAIRAFEVGPGHFADLLKVPPIRARLVAAAAADTAGSSRRSVTSRRRSARRPSSAAG